MYQLFTDGACKANGTSQSKGGWAYYIERDDLHGFSMEQTGSEERTTNNRMELVAVIQGLRSIPLGAKVEIITDSRYVITVSATKNPKIANPDLVAELKRELTRLDYSFTWVRGHSGNRGNEKVDKLASMAARGKIGFTAVK